MIQARLDCIPPTITAQQKRWRCVDGIPMAYDSPKMKAARKLFKALLMPYKPLKPLEGPLALFMEVRFPWRRSELKRNKTLGWRFHDTANPDLDNFEKALIDSMADCGYMKNDGQIAIKRTVKKWGDNPGIEFKLEPTKEAWKK